MKKIFFALCIITYVAFSASCGGNGSPTADNAIVFDSIRTDTVCHLFNDTAKPSCKFTLGFTYPLDYTDKAVLQTMQAIFVSKSFGEKYATLPVFEAYSAFESDYLNGYKALETDYKKIVDSLKTKDFPYSLFASEKIVRTAIDFNKGGLLAFTVISYDYTGGAHGMELLNGYVINVKDGQLLGYNDIFTAEAKDSLTNLLVKEVMVAQKISTASELEAQSFEIKNIVPNNNFLVTAEGVTFIYNRYEIAPYAYGEFKVVLPYADLRGLIKKDSPVAKFI